MAASHETHNDLSSQQLEALRRALLSGTPAPRLHGSTAPIATTTGAAAAAAAVTMPPQHNHHHHDRQHPDAATAAAAVAAAAVSSHSPTRYTHDHQYRRNLNSNRTRNQRRSAGHVAPRLNAASTAPIPGEGDVLDDTTVQETPSQQRAKMWTSFSGYPPDAGDTQPMDSQIYKNFTTSMLGMPGTSLLTGEDETQKDNEGHHNHHRHHPSLYHEEDTLDAIGLGVGGDTEDEDEEGGAGEEGRVELAWEHEGIDEHEPISPLSFEGNSDSQIQPPSPPRFLPPETPAMAGTKRTRSGDMVSSATRTPGSALAALVGFGRSTSGSGSGNGGGMMSLTQVFNGTQAGTSPFADNIRSDPVFQRPSPGYVAFRPSSPLAPMSSPTRQLPSELIPSEISRATTEPRDTYTTMKESQERRRQRRQQDGLLSDRFRSDGREEEEDDDADELTAAEIRAERRRAQSKINDAALRNIANITAPSKRITSAPSIGTSKIKPMTISSDGAYITPARPRHRRTRSGGTAADAAAAAAAATIMRARTIFDSESHDELAEDIEADGDFDDGLPTSSARSRQPGVQVPMTSSRPDKTSSGRLLHQIVDSPSARQFAGKDGGVTAGEGRKTEISAAGEDMLQDELAHIAGTGELHQSDVEGPESGFGNLRNTQTTAIPDTQPQPSSSDEEEDEGDASSAEAAPRPRRKPPSQRKMRAQARRVIESSSMPPPPPTSSQTDREIGEETRIQSSPPLLHSEHSQGEEELEDNGEEDDSDDDDDEMFNGPADDTPMKAPAQVVTIPTNPASDGLPSARPSPPHSTAEATGRRSHRLTIPDTDPDDNPSSVTRHEPSDTMADEQHHHRETDATAVTGTGTATAYGTAHSHLSPSPQKKPSHASQGSRAASSTPTQQLHPSKEFRRLTDIAADPTPPDFVGSSVDVNLINIFTEADEEFVAVMSGSSPVRPNKKRRKVYGAREREKERERERRDMAVPLRAAMPEVETMSSPQPQPIEENEQEEQMRGRRTSLPPEVQHHHKQHQQADQQEGYEHPSSPPLPLPRPPVIEDEQVPEEPEDEEMQEDAPTLSVLKASAPVSIRKSAPPPTPAPVVARPGKLSRPSRATNKSVPAAVKVAVPSKQDPPKRDLPKKEVPKEVPREVSQKKQVPQEETEAPVVVQDKKKSAAAQPAEQIVNPDKDEATNEAPAEEEQPDVPPVTADEDEDGGSHKNKKGGSLLVPNRVWAIFRGGSMLYYPATCLGVSTNDAHRFEVRFDDGTTDDLGPDSIRSLTLQPGDQVKVDSNEMRKKAYNVVGCKDKISLNSRKSRSGADKYPLTDQYGHKTVVLQVKGKAGRAGKGNKAESQSEEVEVPIAHLYLPQSMWVRFKDRPYLHTMGSHLQTPLTSHHNYHHPLSSAPGTPSSRSRKPLARAPSVSSIIHPPPVANNNLGILANMAFAVSTTDPSEREELSSLINSNGGLVLEKGFDELFDLPDTLSTTTSLSKSPRKGGKGTISSATIRNTGFVSSSTFSLTPEAANIGFVALITDQHSRRSKYMQALALGLPCLATRFIRDCIARRTLLPFGRYLLPAGESTFLAGAVHNRDLASHYPPTPPAVSEPPLLKAVLASRPVLFARQNVLLLFGSASASAKSAPKSAIEDRRKTFLFLGYAMGAKRVRSVKDAKEATALLPLLDDDDNHTDANSTDDELAPRIRPSEAVSPTLDSTALSSSIQYDYIVVDAERLDDVASALFGTSSATTSASSLLNPAASTSSRSRNTSATRKRKRGSAVAAAATATGLDDDQSSNIGGGFSPDTGVKEGVLPPRNRNQTARRLRIVSDEFVLQSLILGELIA